MKKSVLVGLLGVAFFAGTLFSTTSIADATVGNAWKSLVARVTNVEQQLGENSFRFVHIEDNEEGHALGWNPDGGTSAFIISDPDVTVNSVIFGQSNGNTCDRAIIFVDGEINYICDGSVAEGAFLNYVVTDHQ